MDRQLKAGNEGLVFDKDEQYDLKKMQHVVAALDFLRGEAEKTGCEEVQVLVDSAFRSVMCAYYLILRNSLSDALVDITQEFH